MIPPLKRSASPLATIQVRRHRPDYLLLVLASIMLGIGLIVMYAISPAMAALSGEVSDNYYVGRQFIAIILGLFVFFISSKIKLETWQRWQNLIIISALLLSIATVVLGGLSNRWIQIGSLLSFQPVELVKFAVVLNGSFLLASISGQGKMAKISALKPLIAIFIVFGFIIIALQKDLGSAFILFCIAAVMAFLAGLPLKRLMIFIAVIVSIVAIAIGSTSYRRERFMTYLQPERDCSSSGYHACQALIAVGSGGVFGVGLGRSVQAYGYLPKAANDSIFAIIAEKFGFVGSVILLTMIGALLLRILNIMQRAPNKVTQLICAGVFAWLAIQSFVNIGAMIGLLPVKGITLPFISAGGTSLTFVMMALGVVFNISSYTNMRSSAMGFDNERGHGEDSNNRWRDGRPRYTITRGRI